MIDLFLAGGFMMFFILAIGLVALGWSLRFALRPDRRHVPVIGWLAVATGFAAVTGTCAGFAAVCVHIPNNPEWAHSPDLALLVMTGIGESLSNVLLGGTLLSLVALGVAVGHRRLVARADP